MTRLFNLRYPVLGCFSAMPWSSSRSTPDVGYVLEDAPGGRDLVVTGQWSRQAAKVLAQGLADGLVLNYARGFCEPDLGFLDGLDVRRLHLLDRGISDLEPIALLADSLEELSVQAAPRAELDLAPLAGLHSVAGEWGLLRDTLGSVDALQSVITWRFDEADLRVFRDHLALERLTIKEAPRLESLSGIAGLGHLSVLGIHLARALRDSSEASELASSLRELQFEACSALEELNDVEPLVNLRLLGFSDCGDVPSLTPVATLKKLESFHAWGSTHIIDGDLSPLAQLPRLGEIRMRDRRGYTPRVADLVSALSPQMALRSEQRPTSLRPSS